MSTYLETNDEKFAIQLSNFASKINTYANDFGITGAEVDSITNDAAFFTWAVTNLKKIETYKRNWTTFKSILKKGESNVTNNTYPDAPILDVVPHLVAPGISFRFTSIANRIKAHVLYTTAIGQNLGIELSPAQKVDLDAAQPILKMVMRAGKVNLDWKKGKFEALLIEKDSGEGFVLLDKDLHPNFVDHSPLPEAGSSAIWKYRAMYLYGGEPVGQWSDIVTVTVSG